MESSSYEGGFVQIKKKLWKGVIRDKPHLSQRIVWICGHNHSRPEFNSRYELESGSYETWETSALNCGRFAYREFMALDSESLVGAVNGSIGSVGLPGIPVTARPDYRSAYVGSQPYLGRIELGDDGHRILTVLKKPEDGARAELVLDVPIKKGLTFEASLDSNETAKILTALWLLKGGVWGVTFNDHRVTMNVDGVNQEAVDKFLGNTKAKESKGLTLPTKPAKQKKGSTPLASTKHEPMGEARIEVVLDGGRRKYEVVTSDGVVKKSFYQRGKAVALLEKIRRKA